MKYIKFYIKIIKLFESMPETRYIYTIKKHIFYFHTHIKFTHKHIKNINLIKK